MSKDSPPPPDYRGAAEEQAEASRDITEAQTWANRPDQFTPFGQTTWSNAPQWDPTTQQYINRWTQNTNLNPQSQAALDAQMEVLLGRSNLARDLTGRLAGEYQDRINFDDFTALGQIPELSELPETDEARRRAEEALYGRMTSRLDPRFQQEESDLRTRLYNQGLREGDAAFQREVDNFARNKTDAYQQAMYGSIIGGGEEAERELGMGIRAGDFQFGQGMDIANYQNQLRQQQIVEAMQERGFTLNEINAMLTGQQVGMPTMPSFSTASRAETPQYLQAANLGYQSELDAFNAEQAGLQGLMSGAAGMFAFSDRRLKRDVKRIGSINGIPLYSFEYIWGQRSVGVMADEVVGIPGAVRTHPSGYLMVNYRVIYG